MWWRITVWFLRTPSNLVFDEGPGIPASHAGNLLGLGELGLAFAQAFLGLTAFEVFARQIRGAFGHRLLDAGLQGFKTRLPFRDKAHFAEAFTDGNDKECDLKNNPACVFKGAPDGRGSLTP